jgi:hypothetical protein
VSQTACVLFRTDASYTVKGDMKFGEKLAKALEEFNSTQSQQFISSGAHQYAAWVLGADVQDTTQVYVINGNGGERVTASSGSQAAIDALVAVLRGHGYTAIKRGK